MSGSLQRTSGGERYLSRDLPGTPSLETVGLNFARSQGITGTDAAALARLRALPAEVAAELPAGGGGEGGAGPTTTYGGGFVIDGRIVTEPFAQTYAAGRQAKVPLLMGAVSNDNGVLNVRTMDQALARFGPRRAEALRIYDPQGRGDAADVGRRVGSDGNQVEPARWAATTVRAQGIPVYLYRFDYVTEVLGERWKDGTPHAGELSYVFNNVWPDYGPARSAKDEAMGKIASGYWVNFVKNGDPNGSGLPAWPPYDPRSGALMHFTRTGAAAVGPDPWKDRLDLQAAVADGTASPRQ